VTILPACGLLFELDVLLIFYHIFPSTVQVLHGVSWKLVSFGSVSVHTRYFESTRADVCMFQGIKISRIQDKYTVNIFRMDSNDIHHSWSPSGI
jgi:hypothetical protein